jgi:hypothetical protein
MVYSDTSIVVYLINGDNKSDDTVTIIKNLDLNDFEIVYKDQNDGTPITHVIRGLYRQRVVDYLYMLFKNQSLDEDAYSRVQVTIPAMPRMIVSGNKFKDLYYREHFIELIGNSLDTLENVYSKKKFPSVSRSNWVYETPVSRRSTAPGVTPQHLFFDEADAEY